MSTPRDPSGSDDETQWGERPPGPGYQGTPSGGFPAQDPSQGGYGPPPGYPQQPPPGYGQPPPGYGPPPGYPQQPPPGYGQPPPGYGPLPGYGPPPGYGQPPSGYGQHPGQHGGFGQPGQQQYGQQPYAGPHGQPGSGQPPPKENSGLPWLLAGGGLLLVIALVAILGFVTPGWFTRTVFDNAAVQNGVEQILREEGIAVESVSCPEGQPVDVDHTFRCQVTAGGQQREVEITVVTARGDYRVEPA